jgi:2'-5' RNA ligase
MSAGERVRAFFALPLPDDLEQAALAAQQLLRRRSSHTRLSLRFPAPDHLHLTLKFLGWVDAHDLPDLAQKLAEAAAESPAFEVETGPLDAFPSARRGRVIVAHLDDPARRISALADACESIGESLGVPRETRPFKSHVTLARLSDPGDVRGLLEKVPLPKQAARFDRVRLYRSTLLPTGSQYSLLAEARLTGVASL